MASVTPLIRIGLEKACKAFSVSAQGLGFVRTKKMFWTRRHSHTVDFVHFHRSGSSYPAISATVEIQVHFGIRVLNDTFAAAALNGPFSDPDKLREGRYHLRFNAETGSTYERCVDDLERFLREQGEPWFRQFASPDSLLLHADSPLRAEEKVSLTEAVAGHTKPESIAVSLKLLGL